MNLWEEIKEGYTDELERCWDKYRQSRELTGGMLETIDKLAHTIKSVAAIEAMEGAGYSNADHAGYHPGNYNSNYNGNYSNAGRKRDSMGRFSREGSYGYSRNDARSELMDHLHGMMDMAESDRTRQMIQKWIKQAESEM